MIFLASLSHHLQTVHHVSHQSGPVTGPPKQKSYPAYCDVNPGMGPGITKMAPYAEHTVTSYNSAGLKVNPQASSSLPVNMSHNKSLSKQGGGSSAMGVNVNQKLTSNAINNHSVINGQNKSRGRLSPTRQPQFIDPPEEFVFSATKAMR